VVRLKRRKPSNARWLALLYVACLIGSLGIGMFLAARWSDPVPSGGVLPVLSGILIEGEARIQSRVEEIIRNFSPRQVMEKAIPMLGGACGNHGNAKSLIGTGDVGTLLFALSDTDLSDPRTFFTVGIPCFSLPITGKATTAPVLEGPVESSTEGWKNANPSPESEGISRRQARDLITQLETPGDGNRPSQSKPEPDERVSLEEARGGNPLVAIYHSHSSEAYRLTSGVDHAWGSEEGVIHVGAQLASILQERYGIPVIHSKKIHDYPVWREAYTKSQKTIKEILEANKSVQIVLDIHRDAGLSSSASFPTVEVNSVRAARVLIVVTSDKYGLPHPRWEENLTFAYQLNAKLDEVCPGLSRGVSIRNDARWNQHVHPRAVIVEIGSDKTKRQEAEVSAVYIADAISRVLQDIGT
jgi:stage II sporulation protein P